MSRMSRRYGVLGLTICWDGGGASTGCGSVGRGGCCKACTVVVNAWTCWAKEASKLCSTVEG